MSGFDLPKECPECGNECGWFVADDKNLFVNSDGSVRIGRGNNTRYGQKVEAICNYPDCDAVVNIYVEAEAVNNGKVESTGAAEILERLNQNDLIPEQVRRDCVECGQEFLTDVKVRLASDGGLDLQADKRCPDHPYSGLVVDTIEHIEPDELDEKSDILPKIGSE